jgi:hypothetical protein
MSTPKKSYRDSPVDLKSRLASSTPSSIAKIGSTTPKKKKGISTKADEANTPGSSG